MGWNEVVREVIWNRMRRDEDRTMGRLADEAKYKGNGEWEELAGTQIWGQGSLVIRELQGESNQ